MNRRVLPGLLAAAAAVMCFLAPATYAQALQVSFGNDAHFPARAIIAAAPASHPLTAAAVHVTEDATSVRGLSVTPLALANSGDFGVILLLDTSHSMAGQPIKQALAAARTLAAQRTGRQELGVIGFNHSASTVVPLTSDSARINSALSHTPTLGEGTHIYDATLKAIQRLHDSNIAAGTVIVLSDGADLGSQSTAPTVASAAAANRVHVYTVGVKDRFLSSRTLVGLAQSTGGTYSAADAANLRRVFSRIQAALTNRYLLRYRSRERLGRRVQVRLWVDGIPGTWTGSYVPLAPAPRLNIAGPTRHVPSPSFWASNLALLLVALSSAVILVGGLLFHFVPRTRQHDLRRRIGRFIRQDDKDVQAESAERGTLSERAQARLSRLRWWPRFEQEVDVAAVERSAVELVLLTLLGTVTAAALLSLVISAPVISLPVLVIGPLVLWTIIRSRADRQRRLFADQLPSHLEQIGSAMRAGHSVVASIAAMAKDAPAPTHREFERALTDESLGVPLDVALRPIAVRMASTDIDQLALVAMLNQRTGGNMAEVLDLIADAARERSELRRELRALTAQARMSRWIVTLLPPAVLGILLLVRPSYLHPLFHSTGGIIALLLATSLVVLGSLVMRMLVPAEV